MINGLPARVALVTGGGSGIGAATAAALRSSGWQVAICGRRQPQLDAVAESTGALTIAADVSVPEDARRVVRETVEHFGRLDGLVLNAGIVRPGPVSELCDQHWDAMVATNLSGPFRTAREALPHLMSSRGGLVGVASMSAIRATAGIAGYNATKAGLVMLIQSIAVDHGPLGVRANALCPGWTRTEMADGEMADLAAERGIDTETAYEQSTALVPLRRPAEADEVAAVVRWLLSDDASYLNGVVLPVDGGQAPVDPGTIAFDPRFSIASSQLIAPPHSTQ
jgi:NAD(P)-dependent dehydrogenase (short-subunit alcohol dehydrogenase family)